MAKRPNSSPLVYVHRPLSVPDHREVLEHRREIDRDFPYVIMWRPLGEAALTLAGRDDYRRATNLPDSLLRDAVPSQVARRINSGIRQMPTEGVHLRVRTLGVDFVGHDTDPLNTRHIAFLVEGDKLSEERKRFLRLFQRMNGAPIPTIGFLAHVSVAQVNLCNMDDSMLDAFERIRPEELDLQPVRARVK